MVDAFANLTREERIEKAVHTYQHNSKTTVRKAAKIYNVAPSTIIRRFKGHMGFKRLKKAKEEADKAERAIQQAVAKDTRETNVEMTRMAKIRQYLFT